MRLKRILLPLLLPGLCLFLADARATSLIGGPSATDFGAYLGWGVGLPRSPGAGLAWKVFKLGIAAGTSGHSVAYSLTVTGRSRKYFFSPIAGASLNYLSVPAGEFTESAYASGRSGVLVTLHAGVGFEIAPDTLLDGGVILVRGYGVTPFASITWPLSFD